ncbi:MAG: hypothetical protein G01um101448_178 [Parcubacteria group bacterium Gr01-1014_48]|nr:MAG: hypothetical protein Greene041614_726 [Parcubacteria group bacterium Greene0416_14]TSC74363.1 MAG: hypothetical protein G01um101448_178 [Parcubacteria group bacterium Gr01-1014_48]TSD00720.1 MAG: hypothetical protein Greene101415_720 [Parcubacteria group bacterium Greene1014_15]TSD07685.1 MAG: hypothetical protein Greene07144_818 [Parcubacteria group bacterium Greene0714_4]
MKKFILIVMVLVVALGGVYMYKNSAKNDDSILDDGDKSDLIMVTTPVSGATVGSPLTVSGEARGTWYFEASFPIDVLDTDGNVLGQGFAEAQGEWMTEEFVPFTGTITFSAPTAGVTNGTVVFKKDNPSGLPENDDSVSVPVQFAN